MVFHIFSQFIFQQLKYFSFCIISALTF